MKKIGFILFVMFVLIISCKSKKIVIDNDVEKKEINYIPYFLKMYEADSLYLVDDYEKSYQILDSLFMVYVPLNSDNYAEYGTYLNCAVKTNHLDNISEKVKYGYLHFGNIQTLHKNGFVMYTDVNKAAKLDENEIKELKLKYYNSLNLDLRKRILKIFDNDQKVRNTNSNVDEILKTDKETLEELDIIFQTYSFPKKSMIGWNNAYDTPDKGRIDFEVIFAHQPDNIKKKYLPIFLENVKTGNSEPWTYAFIFDRMMMDNFKKQTYGTFACNGGEPCEIINPKKIDSIRKSIGLPNIKYYAWKLKQFEEE